MHPQELMRTKRRLFEAFQQVGKDSINMLRNDYVLSLLCTIAAKDQLSKQQVMNMLEGIAKRSRDIDVLRIVAVCWDRYR